ncbi:hypothetical protein FHS25_003780 [Rhizobium laguerreae]|uniref:Uncharacterized protein n=1 Tax=Rhizobium laguerreae TaxID=1076926 RepID=A0ABR6GAJ4_9HYPH|nr:hypothetical protein [Rhizobium laguerreae]
MTNIARRSYPNCPEIAEHQHKMLEGNIISPCECWVTVIRGGGLVPTHRPSSERRLPVLSAKIAMRYKTICLGLHEYGR